MAPGDYLTSARVPDGCGIAPAEGAGRFVASSGLGGVFRLNALTGERERIGASFTDSARWDNHLVFAG